VSLATARALCAAAVLALVLAAPAQARDPGRWQLSGYSSLPTEYWQGVTGDGSGRLFFDGVFEGLYGTTRTLTQTGAISQAIPAAVKTAEGYNHIGDIGYDHAEGGRVLLPFECYVPFQPNGGNTCGTGSIGVADPATLALRYYVKLDPSEIPKAMWIEASPDGSLLWTSSGADLLAYRAADVSAANAPPAAPIRAQRRLTGATPPSGITGAAFLGRRLFLSGGSGAGPFQVWSLDPANGRRRLEIELPKVSGESEGLHATTLLGGELQWLIAPLATGGPLTYGPTSGLLHFTRVHGKPSLRVRVHPAARGKPAAGAAAGAATATSAPVGAADVRVRVIAQVTRRGKPVRNALVRFAGERARTNGHGRATLGRSFAVPGRYRVLANAGGRRGRSGYVKVDIPASSAASARRLPAR
jgi:hypothetical protein